MVDMSRSWLKGSTDSSTCSKSSLALTVNHSERLHTDCIGIQLLAFLGWLWNLPLFCHCPAGIYGILLLMKREFTVLHNLHRLAAVSVLPSTFLPLLRWQAAITIGPTAIYILLVQSSTAIQRYARDSLASRGLTAHAQLPHYHN